MKKYRIVLTQGPGEIDAQVIVDVVTNSEEIATVWSKTICHVWENSDGNATMPDDDGSIEFLDDSHEDVIYLLEVIVLDSDADTGDVTIIDVEEDMPKYVYNHFNITILLADVDPDTE